jgi:hypothetical protein
MFKAETPDVHGVYSPHHRAINRRPHLDQPDSKPNSVAFLSFRDCIQPNQQRAGPKQLQIYRLVPH